MMDSGTEVSTVHHREIHGYYLALQKYFNNAEAKHDRSNSPRAQKARAKLLKLSASQFYELSTDVYDELQRRISDDQSQPEYLLPKATFHMKRNQARQKLANLSHTRFNDLVDDILFEINRRGYNKPPDAKVDENANNKKTNAGHFRGDPTTSIGSDVSNSQIPPTATIQTSKVIPQKASIDWSSDEEQDMKRNNSNTSTNTNTPNTSNRNQESKDIGSNEAAPPSSLGALQQPNTTPVLNATDTYHHYGDVIDSPAPTEVGNNQTAEETSTVDIARNRHSNTFDFEGVSKNETHEAKAAQSLGDIQHKGQLDQLHSEIEALKRENSVLKGTESSDKIVSNENLENELNSLRAKAKSLSVENEQLKGKISNLDSKIRNPPFQNKSSSPFSSDVNQDELEMLALDKESVTRFAAQDGSIPFESVQEFHRYIQKLFTDLQIDVDDIGHTLFEDLARLSHTVAQLFILVDVPEYKEEVILLKASLSHTITSIRYFAVYGALLPRITVQAAISELAFAFCNLVKSCKIKGDGRGGAALGYGKLVLNGDKPPKDPETPKDRDMAQPKFKSPFDHPTIITKLDDDFGQDEMSPVKPLKITQKASISPSMKTPSSARKQSNGFPFGPMVDTRSPASRGKGSSVGIAFEKTRNLNETSPTSYHSENPDSRSLTSRIKDSSQNKGSSKKKNALFTDAQDKNDPNRTLNDNITPEKSATTSRATTADGTTALSTPLSTTSPSVNNQEKLGENPPERPNNESRKNEGPSVNNNKIQRDEDSIKPGSVPNVHDTNRSATNPINSDNNFNKHINTYSDNDSTVSKSIPNMRNKTPNISDSAKSEDISKVENSDHHANRNAIESKDSHKSADPSHDNNGGTREKLDLTSKSSPEQNRRERLSFKDSENTRTPQLSAGKVETNSPEETKKTPEAIKDAISKLEGNSTQNSQEKPDTEPHKDPIEPNPIQEKAESKDRYEKSVTKEREEEDGSTKNSGKSFTEKLRTFATNAGIGLRVDKEQKDKQAAGPQSKSDNSEEGDSNDRRSSITGIHDETTNYSDTRPHLNNDPHANSKADYMSGKTNGLETGLENKKSLKENGRKVDGFGPNLNDLQVGDKHFPPLPHTSGNMENGKTNITSTSVNSASSYNKKSTGIDGDLKNGSSNLGAPSTMDGDISHSGNATPSVTLNDGKGEMDITPKDGFENSLVDHDKGVPSKLPNFYFSNIPQPPTSSNLTDKLKRTFADIPSEDENEEGSDFNNSPYMSDEGSAFRAFKQSLKEENGANRGSPLIQQQTFHSGDSEPRELPAGLGFSEKTDLKLNNKSTNSQRELDSSSKLNISEQLKDENHGQDKQSRSESHNSPFKNHPAKELSKVGQGVTSLHKEENGDLSYDGKDSQRKNSSDAKGVNDSLPNSEYLRHHNGVDTDFNEGVSTFNNNSPKLKHGPPFESSVKSGKRKDEQKRWESTDEEDENDADSFKDAFTEDKLDHLKQDFKNSTKQDDSHPKRDDKSYKNSEKESGKHDTANSHALSGADKDANQLNQTSADELTDDLNSNPSFFEDKNAGHASTVNSAHATANQPQPEKLISSNNRSHDSSSGGRDLSRNEDVTRSPSVPRTPVMKQSASRPQTAKTPSLNNSAAKSPGAKSLASTRTDDGDYTFDVDAFDIENPDNTLSELLLYLEHQSLQVIATIQSLLSSIKEPQATKGNLRKESNAISQVIRQMVDATSISMNQSRNASLKEHGSWVVKSLEDCYLRMTTLCQLDRTGEFHENSEDATYANKHFKQRLAGIAFDIAKCTKELVKTVEEASLKEEIEFLNSRLN